ncbi:PREDICTED: unconventional myosin-VIIa-like [Priapulus caudatus]|uniref:Unconventional myosin-VIIa-like n=1 Tax=Priapulus caudatus TaxID=37621 RepID=A0ABM1DS13_PRICU|nr:PREDICTED: unconventional myosin-VIIa-like [Priapulus caudatus]
MDVMDDRRQQGARPEDGVPDMTVISDIDEIAINTNLKVRYQNDKIYTYTGTVLVAVNPYKDIGIYEPDVVESYIGYKLGELEPHIFAVTETAYQDMCRSARSQSFIISGESGAGKTETTKFILQYLCSVTGVVASWTEQQILEANTILESFGNAKTVRNDNSSRFGKFMQVCFDSKFHISGCVVQDYLLEQSRIAFQCPDERNYHVLYQLVSAAEANQELADQFMLGAASSYTYLSQSGCAEIAGVDDVRRFDELRLAMSVVRIPNEMSDGIFGVLSAILWLGNLCFQELEDDTERCRLSEEALNVLQTVAYLLGLEMEPLEHLLLTRQINVRGNITDIPLKLSEARENRHAMAKALYSRTFAWIINSINTCMTPGSSKDYILGVLDIFGFEDFAMNSFEQLCINYANEKLQQYFNYHVFALEQETYAAEEIEFSHINFIDNTACLELIEKSPTCILKILAEECRFPKGTDETYIIKQHHEFNSHANYIKGEDRRRWADEFGVRHYAGEVTYNVKGFLEKNKDVQQASFFYLMEKSSNGFVKELPDFQDLMGVMMSHVGTLTKRQSSLARSAAKGKPTVADMFKLQLNSLVESLKQTNPWYVRCVKPNEKKVGDNYDDDFVLRQLRYTGMMDIVRIRKQGFPIHVSYDEFLVKYHMLNKSSISGSQSLDDRDAVTAILEKFNLAKTEWQLGKTKVFLRHQANEPLEDARQDMVHLAAISIQKLWQGFNCRRDYRKKKAACIMVQQAFRAKRQRMTFLRTVRAVVTIQVSPFKACSTLHHFRLGDLYLAMEAEVASMVQYVGDMNKNVPWEMSPVLSPKSLKPSDSRLVQDQLSAMVQVTEELTSKFTQDTASHVTSLDEMFRFLGAESDDTMEMSYASADSGLVSIEEINVGSKETEDTPEDISAAFSEAMAKISFAADFLTEFAIEDDTSITAEAASEKPETQKDTADESPPARLHATNRDSALGGSVTSESGSTGLSPPEQKRKQTRETKGKVVQPTASLDEVEAMLQFAAGGMEGEMQVAKKPKPLPKPKKPLVAEKPSLPKKTVVMKTPSSDSGKPVSVSSMEPEVEQQPTMRPKHKFISRQLSMEGGRGSTMSMIVSRPLSTCSSPGVSLTRSMSYQTLWKKTARDAHRKNRVSKLLQEWKLGQTEVEYFNKIMATLAAKEKAKEDEKFYNLLEFANENFNEHPVTVARSGRMSLRKGSSNVAPMSKSDMIMYLDQPHIMTSHINLYDPAVVIMAITTFKEIWKYMHGEVKQDDNAVVRHIVARCIENEALRDEVYCQLMRQTNGCPSQDALLRGWEMMTFCASCFSPSKSLSKYLISYLKKHCNVEALSKYAKTSLRHLRVARITPRKMPPSDTEIKALRGFGLIVCRLRFLDGMSKAVDIQSYDCAETVVKSVSERIGLKSTDGWALYECVGHQERFMRSREYISDIIAKWESGPKKDHGDFLVKKRLFKLPKEMPQDPIEYSLLYAQAVHSVVKLDEFGVSEVTAVQLAGLHCQILLGEPYDNKLDRYDEIGQFLPERITAGKPKQDWRSVLAEAHKEYGSGKPTLVAKVWYLTCVKQFPLYGSTLFPVTYKGAWSHNSDLCLAVHADGVMFVDQRSKDIWYQYRYEEFESISLVPSEDCINFELNAEVADVQKSFTFQTPDKEDVSALIASYSPAHASWLKTGRHVSRKLVRGKERERLQEELIKCRQALVEKGLLRKPNYDSGSTFMSTLRKFRKGGAKLKDEDEAKIFKAYNKEYWSFSKAPITHSLSVMNEEAVASKLFSSILMFSGLQKSGGLGSVSDTFDLIQNVMRECLASVDLRNELFMQLIKQTTDHPEPNSKVNVTHWQLLAVACSVMAPPDKLILSYLQSHLKKCAADHASEEGQHAYFCQKCLAKSIDLKRKWPPSTREIAALLERVK